MTNLSTNSAPVEQSHSLIQMIQCEKYNNLSCMPQSVGTVIISPLWVRRGGYRGTDNELRYFLNYFSLLVVSVSSTLQPTHARVWMALECAFAESLLYLFCRSCRIDTEQLVEIAHAVMPHGSVLRPLLVVDSAGYPRSASKHYLVCNAVSKNTA